jgi:uncharacterized protein
MKAPPIYSVLFLAVACIIAAAYTVASRLPAEAGSDSVGSSGAQGIVDPSGYLPLADLERFDDYLAFIRDESNIDIRLVFARPTSGSDISAAALDTVDRLGVGRDTKAQQGLLLYFDLTAQRLKVEVGYGLEEHFPDAYVAYLVDRHASLFFANANRSLGLRQLLRLLHARIRDATLGGRFDPSPFSVAPTNALSGGAGTNSNLRDRTRAVVPTTSAAASFSAGMSPAETYTSYIDLLAAANWNPDADLFTAESRQYLRQFPLSRAYRDFILQGEYGKAWRVETSDGRALQVFTSTPFVSPHFFVRQGKVWRLDLIAEIQNTKERVGGPLTWSYEGTNDPYTRAFPGMLTVVQGYRRMAIGDNRLLTRAGSRQR